MAAESLAASMSLWLASRSTSAKSRPRVVVSPRATMVRSFSARTASIGEDREWLFEQGWILDHRWRRDNRIADVDVDSQRLACAVDLGWDRDSNGCVQVLLTDGPGGHLACVIDDAVISRYRRDLADQRCDHRRLI